MTPSSGRSAAQNPSNQLLRQPNESRTPQLSTHRLTKKFGAFTAVDDVSLTFEPGLIHAVLGENGAGKSTLLKLLFGLHSATEGEVLIDQRPVVWRDAMSAIRAGLGMVQQHFTLVDSLSVIDNIMIGDETCGFFGTLKRGEAIARLTQLLPSDRLSLPWLAKVETLGVGQKQRVEILKLLFREAKILFLDEPTAVLTPAEINDFFEVLRTLKAMGKSIVLITHKINEVLELCDTYTILRQGKLVARGIVAGSTADTIVEAMIGRKLPEFVFERSPISQESLIQARGVGERRDAADAVHELDFDVKAGEIHGIAGVEGAGQKAFVDMILGLQPHTGELLVLGEAPKHGGTRDVRSRGLGLVPEDRLEEGLWLDESCCTNMMIGLEDDFTSYGVVQHGKIREKTAVWAKEFDVRSASLEAPVRTLSGGNQQKVIFAREVIGRKPKMLICYQPTRGVDLGAIDLIHRKLLSLRNEGMGVLLISSELDELLKLSDRITVLLKGRASLELHRDAFDKMRIGSAMTGALANSAQGDET